MQRHLQHRSRADRVAGTVAEIQLRRLQARTRTEEGGAAKERVRTQPGLPWRLRAKGAKRAKPAEVAAQADAAAVQHLAASDLLQMQPGKWPPLASVWSAAQDAGPPVEGLHQLVVPGPWPTPGSCKAVNGRLAGKWVCIGCGRRAGDSSRAVALARTPCGAVAWEARAAFHELLELDGALVCRRCGLRTTAQHASQASRARCPVASLHKGEQPWPEGEAGLRSALGQICGYRRWCEAPAGAAAAAEVGAAQQGPAEVLPVPAVHVEAEPPAKRARPAGGAVTENPWALRETVEGSMGPLAAAAGPIERRRLKETVVSQAALEARAACSSASVAGLSAFWSRSILGVVQSAGPSAVLGQSAASGAELAASDAASDAVVRKAWLQQPAMSESVPVCVPVPVPVHVPPGQLEPGPRPAVQTLSRAKQARQATVAPAGPAALCVQPYVSHKALRLGRSGLWCLRCFTQPVGDYRVWLKGRCSEERPPSATPSRLSASLLRAGDLEANASEALRSRHAVLLAAARVVPVPAAASRGRLQAGGRQVQEQ
jgi:hypothetical protein